MPRRIRPTEEDGKQSLLDHAADRALQAREFYLDDTQDSWTLEALEALLQDRRFVRYPVSLVFDDQPLEPDEFAYVEAKNTEDLSQGFVMYLRPCFQSQESILPALVAYHLVVVNYGDIAGHEAAEVFGASLIGQDVDTYYRKLCHITDHMNGGIQ